MSPFDSSQDAASAFAFARRTVGWRPSAIREILKVTEAPDMISFAGGLPAPELFPLEPIARAAAAILATDGPAALQYSTTEGYRPLREWVCAELAATVGVRAEPDQALITHGSQQGLDLLGKVLLDPGDIVLMENPGYLGAIQAFQSYEAALVGVAADEHGIRPDALRDALAQAPRRPKMLYLISNFQNPTGVSLAPERRRAAAELAAAHGVPVVEDDPYGRLRFRGAAAPAVVAHAPASDWAYLGTTSKILAPGLRVAWIVTPDAALRDRLVTAKQAGDLHTSTFTQRLAYQVLGDEPAMRAHLDRLREVYGRRRDLMLDALSRHLPEDCAWTTPGGGLFLWVTLPPGIDALALLQRATAERVAFVPGAPFWIGEPRRNTLRLNFSNANEARIEEGIARLGRLLITS